MTSSHPEPSTVLNLPDKTEIRRIGVFKFRNIGDVLLMTPALRALRTAFPHAHIIVAVSEGTEAMLAGNSDINEVWVHSKGTSRGIGRLFRELSFFSRVRAAGFDLTINFTRGERPAWCSWISGATLRVGYYNWWGRWNWRNLAYTHLYRYPDPAVHEVEWHLALLSRLGISSPDQRLRLEMSDNDKTWAQSKLSETGFKKFVAVHAVSRWLFKCWDDSRMARVIDWLQETCGYCVIMTSGPEPKELERAKSIISHCKTKPLSFLGNITLTQTAALISQSNAFLGVDTAPMHMAAALDIPMVALFGPSGVDYWKPWNPKARVLSHGCLCGVTKREGCDWNGVRSCMLSITEEEVIEALIQILPKYDD